MSLVTMNNIPPEDMTHPQLLQAYQDLQQAYSKLKHQHEETLKSNDALSRAYTQEKDAHAQTVANFKAKT